MTRAILAPKLLIKDHKCPNAQGNFPMQLMIPATNFTATYAKLGYTALKNILNENKIKYSQLTIIQASHLKEKLEGMKLWLGEVTLILIDTEVMYTSIKFGLVRKVVNYFTRHLNNKYKAKLNTCLELIEFRIIE